MSNAKIQELHIEKLTQQLASARETIKLHEEAIEHLRKQRDKALADEERWRKRVKLLELRSDSAARILLAHCDDKLEQL